MPSTIEERPTPAPCNDAKASVAANNAQATFRIVFQPAAKSPVPIRRASAPTVSKTMRNLAAAASADPQAQVDLIEALSNPLLYHRHAHLVAYLRSLIQSLETACAAVHAYARGEYMTEEPIRMALKRVAEAWTQMIVPLQLLNGPKIVEAKGNVPNRKDEEAKRKAVGRKLLEMAAEKQRCIDSIKKLKLAYEEGSESGQARASKRFDAALVRLINFATLVATIDHELTIAIQGVVLHMVAEGDKLQTLAQWDEEV